MSGFFPAATTLSQSTQWRVRSEMWEMIRHRRNDSFARSLTRLLAHKKEEGEEQTKERRERREEIKSPQARFPAFLQGRRRAGW